MFPVMRQFADRRPAAGPRPRSVPVHRSWRGTRRGFPTTDHRSPTTDYRNGFTLVEMMVSVTLVMLMMLMFAEIFTLAQETMSKQKGIAVNDQKARILTEVLRSDLKRRTFLDVYPFKIELAPATPPDANPLIPGGPTAGEQDELLRERRRGYFSYSENNPDNNTDDVLQFTVDYTDAGYRLYGVAGTGIGANENWPHFDDGRDDLVGASGTAEVSYFLRNGNLYRAMLLIRDPYQSPPPTAHPTWGTATPDNFPDNFPLFWENFDYSAYRELAPPAIKFHGVASLSNNSNDAYSPFNPIELYPPATAPTVQLFLPRSLGAPQLRFGHSVTPHGQPFEFGGAYDSSLATIDTDDDGTAETAEWATWSNLFFGRFNAAERSHSNMQFPGAGFAPFATATPPSDADNDGVVDGFEGGPRRGVDLMLPNVHAFDVQVWDDVIGAYVNLGHGRTGDNPYTDANGDGSLNDPPADYEPGFYHISRLRTNTGSAPVPFGTNHTSIPEDFGNRYDTWSPNVYIHDAATAPNYFRIGRAPYRPLKANPDPNLATSVAYEQTVAFGDTTLNDDGDDKPREFDVATGLPAPVAGAIPPNTTGDSDAEAPLRAIRITVSYIDPHSGQTRQATIEHSLID